MSFFSLFYIKLIECWNKFGFFLVSLSETRKGRDEKGKPLQYMVGTAIKRERFLSGWESVWRVQEIRLSHTFGALNCGIINIRAPDHIAQQTTCNSLVSRACTWDIYNHSLTFTRPWTWCSGRPGWRIKSLSVHSHAVSKLFNSQEKIRNNASIVERRERTHHVTWLTRLSFVITTPFGWPVVPLV